MFTLLSFSTGVSNIFSKFFAIFKKPPYSLDKNAVLVRMGGQNMENIWVSNLSGFMWKQPELD